VHNHSFVMREELTTETRSSTEKINTEKIHWTIFINSSGGSLRVLRVSVVNFMFNLAWSDLGRRILQNFILCRTILKVCDKFGDHKMAEKQNFKYL
ncbi:MAG: hypothetical protein ACRD63_07500, partial [Pyrinomonadaceae bacterium]